MLVLYRQGSRVVREALKAPISTGGIARSVKNPLVKQKIAEIDALPNTPEIPPHALTNLRFITAVLLGRRILISGVIGCATSGSPPACPSRRAAQLAHRPPECRRWLRRPHPHAARHVRKFTPSAGDA